MSICQASAFAVVRSKRTRADSKICGSTAC